MVRSRSESDFRSLRTRAKAWLRRLRAGDAEALERLEAVLPRHSDPPVLREVQQALARERGFTSWAELKEHCAFEAADLDSLVEVFLEHACIFTAPRDLPVKWRRAERILARRPEIAGHCIHSAVICGDVQRVRELLAEDSSRRGQLGGPQQWEPLLFACYGRVERARETSVDMIEILLDAGADPNACFTTNDDWRLRFTALTGVMGQGEMGQPEHPAADRAARLLLQRGADPNDGQGLYNTSLVGDETRWLELLVSHGLNAESPISWHADAEAAAQSGADRASGIFGYLVAMAATNEQSKRLEFLLEHGADPDARSIYDGKSCYEHALMTGRPDAVELLLRHGASPAVLQGHDAFVAAVRAGDRERAHALVEANPEFRQNPEPLLQAASRGDGAEIELLLDLGVDPNLAGKHGHRALHNGSGSREVAELLLRHGADPRARVFGGTAAGWARHGGNLEMARSLAEASRSLLDAVACGHVSLVKEILSSEPSALAERAPDGSGPLHLLTEDVELAEPIIAMLLAKGADPDLENDAGQRPAARLEAAGADEAADLLDVTRSGGPV